jgi:hypothetical protein
MAGSVSLSLLQRFNWLAHRMGFGQEQTDDIRDAALSHNVGKPEIWRADQAGAISARGRRGEANKQ